MNTKWISIFALAGLAACGTKEENPPADMGTTGQPDMVAATNNSTTNRNAIPDGYATCPRATRVGGFGATLADAFTSVQGQVSDAVNPTAVLEVEASAGGCELLRPPDLFCEPTCTGGTTCAADGSCVALPANRDVGEVTVTGLAADVTMTSRSPVFFYTFTGDLPHPGFDANTEASLTTVGGDFAPFTLQTRGVDALATDLMEVAIDTGTGATVTWSAGTPNDDVRVEIELNIANHGGTPGRIECLAEDTGEFTIPAELVDALLAGGYSGFPALRVTRQGATAVNAGPGCVDLRLKSEIVLPVAIPGLVSCSLEEDCPMGQTCLADLTCG